MGLLEDIRGIIKDKKLGEENLYTPSYKTGLDILDYRSGYREADGSIQLGIDGGKIMTIIGKPGTGKSTLALQIGGNIVDNNPGANLIYLDYERAIKTPRICAITGWSEEEFRTKGIVLNRGISSETLLGLVVGCSESKNSKENYNSLKIDTGKKDRDGDKIYTLPPTVIIVDSIASMVPKDMGEDGETAGSMQAAAIAKLNNQIFKKIISFCETGNVIVIALNHITQKIDMGIVKEAAQINYLKQSESIPGGTASLFLSNTLLRLTAGSKLDDQDGLGIKGFKVIGELIKSRSTESGRKFDMIFSQSKGYLNTETNYNSLKDAKIISGAGRSFSIKSLPTLKFSQKDFLEKYSTVPELKAAVDEETQLLYEEYIPLKDIFGDNIVDAELQEILEIEDSYDENAEEIKLVEEIDPEQNIWLGSDGKYYDGNTLEQIEVEFDDEEK